MSDNTKHFETNAIRLQTPRSQQREHSVPIFATSSFCFDDAEMARAAFAKEIDANIYSRFSNPNNDEFIAKMCALEGTEDGVATASGMAAMFASMAAVLQKGDHLLASKAVFGSTFQIVTQILPKWGIEYTFFDLDNATQTLEGLKKPNTKMVFLETPSNPALSMVDLEWVGNFCRAHNLIFNVDNCFATPYLQNPAHWGATMVTHSATKFIDGQGRVIGGAVLGTAEVIEHVRFFARQTGPAMSPFNGWVLSKSLETLGVRMDRHCANALALSQWLEAAGGVAKASYPYSPNHPQFAIAQKQMKAGGGVVTFQIEGGYNRAVKFINGLQMLSVTSNLGDTRTIVTHPASTTHSKLQPEEQLSVGITPGLIRISVGLEHINDIVADVEQALALSAK